MKKFTVAVLIIGALVLYSFLYRSDAVTLLPATPTNSSSSKSVSPTNVASSAPNTAGASGSGTYKDGSYTGSAADAFYGNIQVKAIIRMGKSKMYSFYNIPMIEIDR